MAHLELHGSGTKVQSVDLPKAGNLLIGSDAVCDIQILDTEVQPIHARLRIQQGQMQVEATPEGKSFRHNGRRVAQCMVAAGDELGFGGYRAIYFAGEPASKPAQNPAQKPVQKPAPATAPTPQKPAAARPEPVKPKPAAPVELSWDDFSEPVPVSPKTAKTSAKPEKISDSSASSAPLSAETGQRSWLDRLLGKAAVKPLTEGEPIVAVAGGRGLTTFADEEATGRKLATAPLIVLLVMTLTGLSETAFGLWWVIDRTRANRA
ncbi:MAG: FHA domain-containing protein, partial [Planctomycetota bacterium]